MTSHGVGELREIVNPWVGQRVMWPYGKKDYVHIGEVGTVTRARDERGQFEVTMDDNQPFHRAIFGSKSKPTGHARVVEFGSDTLYELFEVYLDNVRTFESLADDWKGVAANSYNPNPGSLV